MKVKLYVDRTFPNHDKLEKVLKTLYDVNIFKRIVIDRLLYPHEDKDPIIDDYKVFDLSDNDTYSFLSYIFRNCNDLNDEYALKIEVEDHVDISIIGKEYLKKWRKANLDNRIKE